MLGNWSSGKRLRALVAGATLAAWAGVVASGAAGAQPEAFVSLGHLGDIESLEVSADGAWLLSGNLDGTVKMWDARSGRESRTFRGERAIFAGSTSLLVSQCAQDLVLHDLATGARRELAGTSDGTGFCRDPLAASLDGRQALWVEDEKLTVWDLAGGRVVTSWKVERLPLSSEERWGLRYAFSADRKRLIAGSPHDRVTVWDVPSGKRVQVLEGNGTPMGFSPDGKLALVHAEDDRVGLWDVASGRLVRVVLRGHSDQVAFTPDGERLLTARERGVGLWPLAGGAPVATLGPHPGLVKKVAFSRDGRFAFTGGGGGDIKMWDLAGRRLVRTFDSRTSQVGSVAFSSDGRWALVAPTQSGDFHARLWDLSEGRLARLLTGHEYWINAAALSPDDRIAATAGQDGTARLWDVAGQGRPVAIRLGGDVRATAIAFSPDGQLIAVATTGFATPEGRAAAPAVQLWGTGRAPNRPAGALVRTFRSPRSQNSIETLAFTTDGDHLLGADEFGFVTRWGIVSGERTDLIAGKERHSRRMVFSPDGRMAVDSELQVWRLATAKIVRKLGEAGSGGDALAFSADGRCLLEGRMDGSVIVWTVDGSAPPQLLEGHSAWVRAVAFSPDSRRALTGSNDGSARLWDLASGREILKLVGFTDEEWVAMTPDGRYAGSPGADRHVVVRVGQAVEAVEAYRSIFARPEAVRAALARSAGR